MRRGLGIAATVMCSLALLFVLCTLVLPALLGLQRYVVTGGSMSGTIPKGAVIYSRVTPVDQLQAGDIITFHPPGHGEAVTHRIIAIESGPDGARAYRTKGDANTVADPWNPITLNGPEQARYVFQIPLYGFVLAALGVREARLLLIGLPAVVIAVSLLGSLWRRAGEEVALQSQDDAPPYDVAGRA